MMRFKLLTILSLCVAVASCIGGGAHQSVEPPRLPDTLRVATLYSPTSYFSYRGEEMGYDYDLVTSLVQAKGIALDLQVAPSLQLALEMLDSGLVDLVAYEVPITSEYKERAIACGPVSETTQVLVQPRRGKRIKDVTELVGRDVYVEANSRYHQRISNLNDELGGGVRIHTVDRDTLIAEDLIDMVHKGEIPLTIVASDIARLNRTYYPDLDVNLEVSFPQRSAWAVGLDRQWLADSIDAWLASEEPKQENAQLMKRYFELSKRLPREVNFVFANGHVCPWDDSFKSHAKELNWDWRLLASQAYVESRFDPSITSPWSGATGLMQIMPSTARAYGVDPSTLTDAEVSIALATRILQTLDRGLSDKVPDPQERIKFIIAAYNSGPAHIYDAIALASKIGKNPQVWDGNVAEALLLKSNPEYYNDPVVKHGYFRGRQTVTYVNEVMDFYHKAQSKVK